MKIQRILEHLSSLAQRGVIPQGIIDQGRIFCLGEFDNDERVHGRVTEFVEGLGNHIGQPFDKHPWAFIYDISTVRQDGNPKPFPVVGVVWPQEDGSILVRDFLALPKGLRIMHEITFHHLEDGTTLTGAKQLTSDGKIEADVNGAFYPPAIAILNTRGCNIDEVRAPSVVNAKRRRSGKVPIPARYDVDAKEYFTALRSSEGASHKGGSHASPLPHLRRGHPRRLQNGERILVKPALVNVRREGDLAFVERRKAYRKQR